MAPGGAQEAHHDAVAQGPEPREHPALAFGGVVLVAEVELGLAGLEEYRETKHVWHNTRPARAGWFADRKDAQ